MRLKINFGFTLPEILVYIAVFSVVIIVLTSFIIWMLHSNIKAQVTRETLDNAKRAMETMIYEIKSAQSIYTPTNTSTQLSLETPHYLPEGESSSYLDFFLCGTQICLKKESQSIIPLTSDKVEIKNLSFTQIATAAGIPSVQINLEAEYKNPQNLAEYRASVNLSSCASLRSY